MSVHRGARAALTGSAAALSALRAAFGTSLRPGPVGYRRVDVLRGGLGAVAGIALAALTARTVPGGPATLPFVVAPMGATAVLLFAAPASPLAQPWSVLLGNLTSTAVGVAVARVVPDVMTAAAVAVALAIGLMMLLRCVHPPGGACALFTAVGGPAVTAHGFAFVLWPVGVNTVVLLVVAVLVNTLTGRRYPHVPEPPPPAVGREPSPRERTGMRIEDVRAAMSRRDEGLDVLPDDVLAVVREAEEHALDRRLGRLRCGTLMARDVQTVRATDTIFRARMSMNNHHLKALPVVDGDAHVVGIVTMIDLFSLELVNLEPVSRIMSSPVTSVTVDTPVADLVALMSDRGLRTVPVLDDGRLAGLVTRAELIAVLNRAIVGG